MKRDTTKTTSQAIRKLTLSRVTLKNLTERQLAVVAGASGPDVSCQTRVTCPPCGPGTSGTSTQ
jgi:hypothetical protein